jgi:hypothetical protein
MQEKKSKLLTNICLDCYAIRQYPDGKKIDKCPRCDSANIKHELYGTGDKELLQAITGDYPPEMFKK